MFCKLIARVCLLILLSICGAALFFAPCKAQSAQQPLVIESEKLIHTGNIYENPVGEGYSCSTPNPRTYICYVFVDYEDNTRYIDIVYNEPIKSNTDIKIRRRAGTLKCLDWLDKYEYDRENYTKGTVSAKHYTRP